jgi:hypothetical protein
VWDLLLLDEKDAAADEADPTLAPFCDVDERSWAELATASDEEGAIMDVDMSLASADESSSRSPLWFRRVSALGLASVPIMPASPEREILFD